MKNEFNPYDITQDLSFEDITAYEKQAALSELDTLVADTRAELED